MPYNINLTSSYFGLALGACLGSVGASAKCMDKNAQIYKIEPVYILDHLSEAKTIAICAIIKIYSKSTVATSRQ